MRPDLPKAAIRAGVTAALHEDPDTLDSEVVLEHAEAWQRQQSAMIGPSTTALKARQRETMAAIDPWVQHLGRARPADLPFKTAALEVRWRSSGPIATRRCGCSARKSAR